MTINNLKRMKLPAVVAGLALTLTSLFGTPSAYAVGEITMTTAPTGTTIMTSNAGTPVEAFTPTLGPTIQQGATSTVAAYYGVRILSATTTGDVHWRITVDHVSSALSTGMVGITEVGYFDAVGYSTSTSPYATTAVGGDLVLDGNSGWNTATGDDFTNVDQISFSASAPTGLYTVTRVLIDNSTTTAAEIDAPYSFVVNLTAAAVPDITPPVFGTTTDVMATASSSATSTAVIYTLPTATDNLSATTTVICTPPSGSVFAVGTTTVNCTAMDDASNTATTTFNVIVDAATSTPDVTSPNAPILTSGRMCSTTNAGTVSGTAEPGSEINIVGNGATTTATTTSSGNWSVSLTLQSETVNSFSVTATDASGNVSVATLFEITQDADCDAFVDNSGGGGGGSNNNGNSNNNDNDTSPATSSVLGGSVDGAAFVSPINPSSPFQQVLGTSTFLPGIPNTGAGGEAATNIALLLGSLGLVTLGTIVTRKYSQGVR